MAESLPEQLVRGANSDPDRMTMGPVVERPEIRQDNDVDTPFEIGYGGQIPETLQQIIQMSSVDEELAEVEQVAVPLDSERIAEENPTSRFRVLDTAIKKPGVCALCGSAGGDGRQFIDFGKTMEWYGVVYFCTFCVSEAAKLLGFATYGKYDELFKKYEATLLKLGSEVLETQFLREQLNASRLLLRNCHCGDGDSSDSNVVDVQVVEEPDGESPEDSSDGDESGVIEEPGDVPETPVDDNAEPEPEKPKRTRRGSSSS